MTDPAPTTRSIDERVARVENTVAGMLAAQSEMKAELGLVRLEGTHVRELLTAYQGTLTASLTSLTTKVDNVQTSVTAAAADRAARMEEYNDYRTKVDKLTNDAATSAGVDLKTNEQFASVLKQVSEHQTMLDRLAGMGALIKVAIGGSVIGLIVGIVSLIKILSGA